jgi:hypothetical protein
MRRFLFVILLFTTIFNNVYSSEKDNIYDFFDNITNELQRTRELCIIYHVGIYNNEELQIIENDMKIHLSNILLSIRDNRIFFENDNLLKNIFTIIHYETNNIFNMNFVNNSYEMFSKIDTLLELIVLAYIIEYYEPLISGYNL